MLRRRFLAAIAVLTSSSSFALTLNQRGKRIGAMDTREAAEALDRKRRSEALLRVQGVPLNPTLPPIEASSDARLRSTSEVATRTLALLTVAVKGEGLEQRVVDRIVTQYNLGRAFTPKEQAFLRAAAPTDRDRIQFSWRYESTLR